MAMTLTGFVYDNAGNAISGATVQGYVSADNATTTAIIIELLTRILSS